MEQANLGLLIVRLITRLAVMLLSVRFYVSPKGPCAQIVYTLGPRYPNSDYCKKDLEVTDLWLNVSMLVTWI